MNNAYYYSQALEVESLMAQCSKHHLLGPKLQEVELIEITYDDDRRITYEEMHSGNLDSLGSVFIVNILMKEGTVVVYSEEFFDKIINMSFKEVVTILGLQEGYWRLFV